MKPILHTPEVRFQGETGMVNTLQEYCDSMTRFVCKVTAKATLKDFNPKTQDVTVMGSYENKLIPAGVEIGSSAQLPSHEVLIGDFFMDTTEVTEKQWRELMGPSANVRPRPASCPRI